MDAAAAGPGRSQIRLRGQGCGKVGQGRFQPAGGFVQAPTQT